MLATAGNNQATITWTPPANAEAVELTDYFVKVTPGPRAVKVEAPASSAVVSGLRNGTEYEFTVYAATADGSSEPSEAVRATPSTGMEGEVAGLIVKFEAGTSVAEGQLTVPGEEKVDSVDLQVADTVGGGAVLVDLSESVSLTEAKVIAGELASSDKVEWAEPDQFLFTSSDPVAQPVTVPDDSQYASGQWNLWDTYGVGIGDGTDAMTDAWSGGIGAGATVAVIDTGISAHEDLDSQLVSGYDFVSSPAELDAARTSGGSAVSFDGDYVNQSRFGSVGRDSNPADPGDWRGVAPIRDSSWHGTKMAGIIAAQARNSAGITGIAPGAKIQPIRALSWRGGLLSDIASSITWASGGRIDGITDNATPSDVINMSFAVQATCPVALQNAIDEARARGAVLVASAGNANDDVSKYAPANCNNVITVGATDRSGMRAPYSNYGERIDISAPGGDINSGGVLSTSNTGTTDPADQGFAADQGTSIAAAHVSAAAALIASRDQTLTPEAITTAITGKAIRPFANSTCDSDPTKTCGDGILSLAQIATASNGDQDYAMSFAGTSNVNAPYGQSGSTTFLSSMRGAFTFEIWVKPTSCSNAENTVFMKEFSFGLDCQSGYWRYQLGKGADWSGYRDANTGIAPQMGQWQHVAVTRSAQNASIEFYFNGQLAHTATAWDFPIGNNASYPLYVGARPGAGYAHYFVGQIDELRFYNSYRGSSVSTDMHTYGPVDTTGLVAYYDFNEGPVGSSGTGTVVNRASGAATASNLRLVGSPLYADVKQVTSNGSNTVVTFPRSFLTAAGGWIPPSSVASARALVVGGGGAGGMDGGGGGGGGALADLTPTLSGTAVRVTVGQGGIAGSWTNGVASRSGIASSLVVGATTYSAAGGAAGTASPGQGGGSGGSGGSATSSGGSGGQGNGSNGPGSAGSSGPTSNITGVTLSYSGGGGGGIYPSTSTLISGGAGGGGGGGAGASGSASSTATGTNGRPNSGGGGGGGKANFPQQVGGYGGSGVVVISYASASTCTPVTTNYVSGSTTYRVVSFTDPGTCSWTVPSGVTSVDAVLVAGGGGGGGSIGGGGGGGEFRSLSGVAVTGGASQSITVGVGGAPGVSGSGSGGTGGNTSALSTTVKGGGGGATLGYAAVAGGSGGGGVGCFTGFQAGAGTSTLGGGSVNSGGSGSTTGSETCVGGGGGGAGGVGGNFSGQSGGAGGTAASSSITGTTAFYGAGGGGGVNGDLGALSSGTPGGGGSGIGGAGGVKSTSVTDGADRSGLPASAGTGSGGGGASNTSYGGAGGSGAVIIRYVTSYVTTCTSPVTTSASGYVIVAFKTSETCSWTPPQGVSSIDYLVVAGGGGGGVGRGGGGGAGGMLASTLSVMSSSSYTVTVGAGGSGGASDSRGTNGGNSVFGSISATGGGGGGGWGGVQTGSIGGSGGGGAGSTSASFAGGAGTTGQGNAGGASADASASCLISGQSCAGGGGGGASAAGAKATATAGGAGGDGSTVSWITSSVASSLAIGHTSGGSVYFAGGGGGGALTNVAGGAGGLGGGAVGRASTGVTPAAATANTGGGGGGNEGAAGPGGAGGSGVIVVRYALPTCVPQTYAYSTTTVVEFQGAGTCSWTPPTGVTTINYLLLGGGGGGGADGGAGGGGGSIRESTSVDISGDTDGLTVAVGSGGAGGVYSPLRAPVAGGTSSIEIVSTTYTAPGGSGATNGPSAGATSGGSGGNATSSGGAGGRGSGDNGIASSLEGAPGSSGPSSSITGSTIAYGGGGGGGIYPASSTVAAGPVAGGAGGGGAGAQGVTSSTNPGSNGANGLGGGGGGGKAYGPQTSGGNGGDGVVVISYSLVPGAPTSVTGTASAPTTATVSWTAPTYTGGSAITGYSVAVSAGGGAYAAAAAGTCTSASSSTSTSCTVTGLTAGTTYAFKVNAINANGAGTQSAATSSLSPFGALDHFDVTTTAGGALGAQTASTSFNVMVTAQDSGNRTVLNFTGTVGLTSTSLISSGTSTTTAAFTSGVLSSHAITLLRAGSSQTVTATRSTGGSETGTSGSFTISPGTVNKLQVLLPGETAAPGTTSGKTGTPTAQTATTSFNATVNAVDANWNVVSSATPTVRITSTDSAATLPSNAALVAGTRAFPVTLATSGSATVTATDQAGTPITAGTSASVTVNRTSQATLTMSSAATVAFGSTLTLTTSGGSGTGAVTYAVTTTGTAGCSISGDVLSVTGNVNSTCSVTATKAQDSSYSSASSAAQTITVGTRAITVTASSPSIAFGASVAPSVSVTTGTLSGSDAISGATYTYTGTGGTSYGPLTTAPTAVGTYLVTPSAATFSSGSSSNYAIAYAAGTLTISQAAQATLSMSSASTVEFGGSLTLTTTGGSGSGTVTYAVTTTGNAGCSISGTTLSVSGNAGATCAVTATKAADASYLVASSTAQTITVSTRSITVTASSPSIAFGAAVSPSVSVTTGTLSGSDAISGATYTYTGTGGTTYGPLTTAPTAVGTYTVTPSVATFSSGSSSNYAIQYAAGTLTISQASQAALSFAVTSATLGSSTTLATSGGSGSGTVSYTLVAAGTATCSLSGAVLSYTSGGTCTISATKAADSSYLSATTGSVTFTVNGPSTSTSTITAGSASITADGTSTSTITVQLKDSTGTDVTTNAATVALSTTAGTLSSVTYVGAGAYTATLTSPTTVGSATVSGTLNSLAMTDTETVTFVVGAAAKILVVTSPVAGASEATLSTQPVVRITDANDNTVTASTASVTIAPSAGSMSGTLTVAAVNGVATFAGLGLTASTASATTLTFSSTGLTSATSTVTPTGPGAAAALVVTGSASQSAGASQDLTITAKDLAGNTATAYTGDKSLTFSGASQAPDGQMPAVKNKTGTSVVFGTSTTITFTNGVASVSSSQNGVMTLYKAESATVSVTDGSISSSGSDRLSVAVSADAASKLAMGTQPVAGTAGSVLSTQPVVNVVDAYGNATTSTSTVTVTASGGTVGGAQASSGVAAVSGSSTFTNLTFAGLTTTSYTLTFASTGLTSVTSTSITPSGVGALSQFAVTRSGGTTSLGTSSYTAGTSISMRVTAQDAGGNTVTSFTGSVTLTSTAWSGSVSSGALTAGVKDSVSATARTADTTHVVQAVSTTPAVTTVAASSTFTVVAGTATKLIVDTQPVAAASGALLATQPVVRVSDAYGNTVTNSTASVTAATTINSGWVGAGTGPNAEGLAYGNALWVGVAQYGMIMTSSDDGATWTRRTIPSSTPDPFFQDVAYGNSRWVAVASNSTTWTSTNGTTWTQGTGLSSSAIAFANGTWTTGNQYSSDGLTWLAAAGQSFKSIIFAAGRFWGINGDSQVAYSYDGRSWTYVTTITSANSIAFGNGTLVVTRPNAVMVSSNFGSTWVSHSIVGTWQGIGFGNGEFRMGASNGQTMVSQDGVNWTDTGRLYDVNADLSIQDLDYANGTWLVTGTGNTTRVYRDAIQLPVLEGTTTLAASAVVAGEATFSDLSLLGVPGTNYTLTFTSTGLTPVTSAATTPTSVGVLEPSTTVVTAADASIAAGSGSTAITVQLRDSAGNNLASSGASVSLTASAGTLSAVSNNGNGTYSATLTAPAQTGQAVVSATVDGTAIPSKPTVWIVAGAASALAISTQPVAGASGATMTTQPVVRIVDASGNTVSSSSASVTVTAGTGTLGGTTTVSATSGVATFSGVTFSGLSSTTHTLTFASSGLTSATTTVQPTGAGSATTIALNAGNNQSATAGSAVSTAPSVLVTDAGGNPVSGRAITFAVASGGGSRLPATTVNTNASGIATVTSWTLGTTAGVNTLTATSASLTGSPVTFTATGTAGTVTKFAVTMTGGTTALSVVAKQAGEPFSVRVSAQDANGNVNSAWTGSVTVTSTAFAGNVVATIATGGFVDGVALTPTVLGATRTITAASGGITTASAAGSFTVDPGPAASFTVTTSAGAALGNQVAGVPFTAKITAYDQFSNVSTGFSGTVTLSATSGTILVNGSLTTTTSAFTSGVATPSLQLTTAATQTITATMTTGTPAPTGSSASFTVSPGDATRIAITNQPSSMAAGASISPQPTGRVIDDYGNTVTTSSASVTLANPTLSSWSTASNVTNTQFFDYGAGKFVGFSHFNYPMMSTDGISWTVSNSQISGFEPRGSGFGKNASGNPLWMAVGAQYNAANATSMASTTDGINWTRSSALGDGVFKDCAYGQGTWVAVGNSIMKWSSNGGLTWNVGSYFSADSVSYGGGLWIAGGEQASYVSRDGRNWTLESGLPATGTVPRAAYGNGRWVVGQGSQIRSSTDGVTWSAISSPVGLPQGVAYGSGTWLIGGNGGTIATSPDGETWTTIGSSTSGLPASTAITNVAAGHGRFVASSNFRVVAAGQVTTGLSGTTTISAANGILDFSNAQFGATAGSSQRLALTSTNLAGVQTNAFTVTAGAASTLTLTRQSVGTASGSAFTTQPQVSISDLGGNAATSDNSTVVTATVSAGATLVGTTTATAVNGVATFSNLGISGVAGTSYTITYASGSLTSATQSVTPSAGSAASLAVSRASVGTASGAAFTTQPQISVKDSGGNTVTSYAASTVTASISSGGTLVGTTTAATTSGVATFSNLGITGTAGTSYTITYSLGALTVATASVTVTVGAATTIAMNAGNGQSATAGSAVATAPSVIVTDSGGNPVSGTSVTFAVASGGGSRLPSSAVTTNSSGVAALTSWTLGTTAGSNTLTATSGSLSGSPITFTATGTAGAASQLVRTTAAAGTASGATFTTQPVISLQDANSNVVITDSASVVTASVSAGGTLLGTTTATAVNGVATFTDLGISGTAGNTYVITYSSGPLTPVTQNVTVSAGAATQVVLTTSAAGATYGNTWATQPVVQIRDSAGNVRTTDSSSVVTINVSTGGAIVGTATATASSGVATFSGLALMGAPATYTLTYSAGALTSATQVLALSQASQSVTFGALSTKTYGDAAFGLSATASSGLSVTFASADSSICSVSGSAVSIVGAGTCTITASQAGNTFYSAATPVAQAFTISQANQATLAMASASSAIYGETIALAASGGSGTGALVFGVTAGTCTVSGTTLTLGNAGSNCRVQATKVSDANYNSTTSSVQTITIARAGQVVSFTSAVPASPLPNGTYTPAASSISTVTGSSSGLTPVFTIRGSSSAVCSISGGVVSFLTTGNCVIDADSALTTNFTAAATATQTISVGSLNQNITFAQPSNVAFGTASVSMGATASSDLTVSYSLGSGTTNSACAVSILGVVTILAVGTCEVTAAQVGDAQYAAASPVTRAFQVLAALASAPHLASASAGDQAITVAFNAPGFTGGVSITAYRIVATPVSSGTTVTSTACTSSPCTITGLVNGTSYTVTVAAINTAGTGTASSVSTALTPATAAFAVSDLAAVAGDTIVNVSWTPLTVAQLGGGTFTRYEVYSRTAGTSSWTLWTSALTFRTDHSSTVTGLTNGTSYDFRVVAITSANASEIPGNTAEVVQYPSTAPSAPRSLTTLAATATDLQVSWQSPLSDGGAPLISPYYSVTVTSTSSGAASPITCTFASVADRFCTAANLTNGALYNVSVGAINRMGTGTLATTTYAVPSSDATLADLEVNGTAGPIALSPSFASGTNVYTAEVANDIGTVTVTATTTMGGSTFTVNGTVETSGVASASIPLEVGTNTVTVIVTAADVRFDETYEIEIIRAPSNSADGRSWTPPLEVSIPATALITGSRVGAVTESGSLVPTVLDRNPTDSGWRGVGEGFSFSIETRTASGAPQTMTAGGVMRVSAGGTVAIRSDGYLSDSRVTVFAVPRAESRSAAQSVLRLLAGRDASDSIYLGSASVNSNGAVNDSIGIPARVDAGDYVLQINGYTPTSQVRSMNLALNVLAPPKSDASEVKLVSKQLVSKAFYEARSDRFTADGLVKMRDVANSVPQNARNVKVKIAGASVGLGSISENVALAGKRAERIADYLVAKGIQGDYEITFTTSFKVGGDRDGATDKVDKPLTTIAISYDVPVATT